MKIIDNISILERRQELIKELEIKLHDFNMFLTSIPNGLDIPLFYNIGRGDLKYSTSDKNGKWDFYDAIKIKKSLFFSDYSIKFLWADVWDIDKEEKLKNQQHLFKYKTNLDKLTNKSIETIISNIHLFQKEIERKIEGI